MRRKPINNNLDSAVGYMCTGISPPLELVGTWLICCHLLFPSSDVVFLHPHLTTDPAKARVYPRDVTCTNGLSLSTVVSQNRHWICCKLGVPIWVSWEDPDVWGWVELPLPESQLSRWQLLWYMPFALRVPMTYVCNNHDKTKKVKQ